MTASPELINELRATRPAAPDELRTRVRTLAAAQPVRRPRLAAWRFPVRRGLLIAVPAAAAVALASAGVLGLARPEAPQALSQASAEKSTAGSQARTPAPTAADAQAASPAFGAATTQAQRVSATLTVEVRDSNAVSRAAQDALELTRSLGGYVVSSSVATGDTGSAAIVVRVPVTRVQDAVAGLSGLGRIVSQQVTIDDLQANLDELQRREAQTGVQIARVRARLDSGGLDAETEAVLRAKLHTLRAELVDVRSQIAATNAEARMSTIQLTVVTRDTSGAVVPPSRIHRAIDQALNVLAWEGIVVLGLLIVLTPLALVAACVLVARRLYRRREEERLLAA